MKKTSYYVLLLFFAASSLSYSQSYEWGGRFGGFGEDVVKGMHVDHDGNTFTTGYFTDEADFDISSSETNLLSNGFYDVFVQKTDAAGNFQWAKSMGGASFDYGTSITTDISGNVYITGSYEDTVDFNPGPDEYFISSTGGQDIFIVKLDPEGNFVWAKSVGGVDYEESTAIGVDPLGNVIVTGYLYSTVDFDPGLGEYFISSVGASDGFILRLDTNGEFQSANRFGGADLDLPLAMTVAASGDVHITGIFEGTSDFNPHDLEEYLMSSEINSKSGFVLHLNNAGGFMKAVQTFGGETLPMGIAVDSNDNVHVSGYFNGAVNFNTDPTAGDEFLFISNLAYNGFVMKIGPLGALSWARHLASDEALFTFDVAVDSEGIVRTVGYFDGVADFDPASGTEFILEQSSTSPSDAFLSSLDADGNFLSAYQFGGVNFIDTHQIGIDGDDHIYMAAHFTETVDINPLANDMVEVTALDFRDNYLIKMNNETLGTPEFTKAELYIYPNPVQDRLYVQGRYIVGDMSYQVTDIFGRTLLSGTISEEEYIEIGHLPTGTYILKFANSLSFKVLKR